MGWQDVIGSVLTAGATGDPMAFQRNKLEQAFKQFQMQKATDELEMQREMHGIEKQKLDILLKQKKREEDLDNSPVAGILKVFGITPPEGSEGMTVGQAKQGVPIADMFRKQEKKPLAVGGKGVYEEGEFKQAPWADQEEIKAPTTRHYTSGDKEITEEFDKTTGTWKTVANAPRYKPDSGDKPRKPHEIGKDAAGLRKELNNLPEVKEYNTVRTKISAMESAYKEAQTTKNFVAADQAMITLFNKMTDPQSVVRESEYARTGVSMPLINAIKGKASKIRSGGAGLTSSERDAIMKMANLFNASYKQIYGERVKEYRGYAQMQGLDPNMIAKEEIINKDPLGIR